MTEPRWLNDEEQRAWRGLMAMDEGLSAFIDRRLRTRCGLSYSDYRVLAHLSEATGGQLRSFQLGGLLRWEKSRLSQHLSRMQTRGLVSRERSQADQRGAVVTITPEGRRLMAAAAPQHVADVREAVIDQLTPAELRTLTKITDKVRRRLAALDPELGTDTD
ncbi:MarR family transcriptional regulator [Actinoplanes philippinensis]|uniref:DNA-binding transcriptional regulator, MarR family n=1 Tax=Actinoplanes philippinensis TaxID=35752 RepID=A0A1I2N3C0_9ACTN|nr:MarR family winged helix-turn-helix transcriptional regulator [Actinoplanes philippinensis]GIE76314.1 MarR family transcriptional regulator [Actinoplanes philippinensis]SFF98405.1 DNA-binding transcriptional regulator, MarR family [Actinoplanes philippinensis]